MKTIKIGNKLIGEGQPTFIIAEIGSNFDGSLERAKKLIDLAKECGADAVKFQSFKSEKIVSNKGFEGLKVGFQSKWKEDVISIYKKAELPREWHKELFEYSKQKELIFFSAPYDKEAVDLLDKIGIEVFKIGSGDIIYIDMLKYIAKKGKPIMLATGASTFKEVEEAVKVIKEEGNDQIILLQCVTNYPSKFESANIKVIETYKKKFDVLVGYSDHTPGYIVPMGTVALGGCVIEKHFTDDKTREGPDHPYAMGPKEFKLMVNNIRTLEKALGESVKGVYPEENETVIIQRRCIRAKQDIPKETKIGEEMLTVLRPAPKGSLPPKYLSEFIGKESLKDIKKGDVMRFEMVGEGELLK